MNDNLLLLAYVIPAVISFILSELMLYFAYDDPTWKKEIRSTKVLCITPVINILVAIAFLGIFIRIIIDYIRQK